MVHQHLVLQAAAQARVEVLQPLVRGDDGGELCVVAVVQQLEELLLRPRRAALAAQVVQDEQRRRAHHLEELVVGSIALGAERGPQMVQQVRHDHEDDRLAQRQALVGDGRGQVRLAAAVGPGQQEPAFGIPGVHAGRCRRRGGG